jgi:hypothetical protein
MTIWSELFGANPAVFAMDVVAQLSEADRAALLASVDWRNNLIHES